MSGHRRGALRVGAALVLVLLASALHAARCASVWWWIAPITGVSSAESSFGVHTHFHCKPDLHPSRHGRLASVGDLPAVGNPNLRNKNAPKRKENVVAGSMPARCRLATARSRMRPDRPIAIFVNYGGPAIRYYSYCDAASLAQHHASVRHSPFASPFDTERSLGDATPARNGGSGPWSPITTCRPLTCWLPAPLLGSRVPSLLPVLTWSRARARCQ